VYGQTFIPFTKKQLGQLKHFKDACPPGKSAMVLEWAVRHWIEFVKQVEQSSGYQKTPTIPDVGFLLHRTGIAVQMALPQEKVPVAKKHEASQALPEIKPVQLISPGMDDYKPQSLAEILALLGDGGSSED